MPGQIPINRVTVMMVPSSGFETHEGAGVSDQATASAT